jgi:hypothetical protein
MHRQLNGDASAAVRRLGVLASAVVLAGAGLSSQTQSATAPASDEYLLLGSANRGAGEPIVFVNPKDANNIIVVAMATLNRLPGGETPIPRGTPEATRLRVKELSTPDGSRTDIAITWDGGKTWSITEDNFRAVLQKNRCSDSYAGAGPDGTLYMGCLAYLNRGDADFDMGYAPNGEPRNMHGGSAIAWSKDKGQTWSQPTWVHPAQTPSVYAPGLHPVFEQASPWDRPYFVADALTGTIYVSGSGPAYTVDPATVERPKVDRAKLGMGYTGYPPTDVTRGRTFLRASRDQGRTWGLIYAIDSDEYPGGRGSFSAARGHLVVAYTAANAPAAAQVGCPCTVIGSSEDDGKTFSYRVVPPLSAVATTPSSPPPAQGPGRGGASPRGGVMIGADPTMEHRYAIARQVGQSLVVSITEDGARTWLPPVTAAAVVPGATIGHRALKYSARGDLALIWKAMYPDNSFDVWSAVSRDNGRTFKTVRVSHAISPPYIPERGNFLFGDDLSSVDIDSEFLHVVWGDNRAGFLGTWFGRVPLSAF